MLYFSLFLGLMILVAGAEFLIRGASSIASRLGMSNLLIGLTIVAFGTSAPELAVSIKAALADQGGIALGNIIGSNIFNATLILGITSLICPLRVELQIIKRELPVLLCVSLLFAAIVFYEGGLNRIFGLILVTGLCAYTFFAFRFGVLSESEDSTVESSSRAKEHAFPLVSVGLIIGGLAMLVFGARLFVSNAVLIAQQMGVSETIIGLTIVAAGTSLPELAASIVAAIRGKADMAIGNIIGSNLFNILCIGGISSLIRPFSSEGIEGRDLLFMIGSSAILVPLMRSSFRLSRFEGLVLILGFGGYLFLVWPR